MQLDWDQTIERMASAGIDGKYLPAYTGAETDAELRELVHRLIDNCSVSHSHNPCVFRGIKGLHLTTIKTLVSGFSRESCIEFLNDECECRNLHGGRNCQINETRMAVWDKIVSDRK